MIPNIPFFPNFSCNATEGEEYILYEKQNVSSSSTKKIVEEPMMNQQDLTFPDTIDNSLVIDERLAKSVNMDQSSDHTSPEDLSTPEVDQSNEGPSSSMSPSNGPMTLKENDQRCEKRFWDILLECYKKKDPNCFTEPGLAALYKDCD